MKKIIIIILLSLMALITAVYLYNNYQSRKPFRCDNQIKTLITMQDRENLALILHITVVFTSPEKGDLVATGSLTGGKKDYIVSRKVTFETKHSALSGINKTTINSEVRHEIDNIPDEIWQKYIMPEKIGVEFYLETKRLNKNAVLIKGLSNPYFVCTRSSH